jgi:hypothetical protein
VYPAAEVFPFLLDVTQVTRLRVVIAGCNTGQTVALEIEEITLDSVA